MYIYIYIYMFCTIVQQRCKHNAVHQLRTKSFETHTISKCWVLGKPGFFIFRKTVLQDASNGLELLTLQFRNLRSAKPRNQNPPGICSPPPRHLVREWEGCHPTLPMTPGCRKIGGHFLRPKGQEEEGVRFHENAKQNE